MLKNPFAYFSLSGRLLRHNKLTHPIPNTWSTPHNISRLGIIVMATLSMHVNAQTLGTTADDTQSADVQNSNVQNSSAQYASGHTSDGQSYSTPEYCNDIQSLPGNPPVNPPSNASTTDGLTQATGTGTVLAQTSADTSLGNGQSALQGAAANKLTSVTDLTEASAGTQNCYQGPSRPGNASAAPSMSASPMLQNTSATVTVNSLGSGVTYEIYQRINSGSYIRIHRATSRSKSVSISSTGTAYYRYRGCNSAGCGGYSPIKTVPVNAPPSIPAPTPPNAPSIDGVHGQIPSHLQSTLFGAVPGEAAVSGGAAQYTIPIQVIPGRAGMQPNVSLSYSSRQGAGIAGVGWSLSAGGGISRCGQTLAQDGRSKGVTFAQYDDRLCANGKRLMRVSGTYGQYNAVYAYEHDDNTRVYQYGGHINQSSTYFKMVLPNGHEQIYGDSSEKRLIPSGRSETLTWLLSTHKDVARANNIQYRYISAAAGEKLLNRIVYTGAYNSSGNRAVYFRYEDRLAPSVSYLAGGKTQTTKRLAEIYTRYNNQTVKTYDLDYQQSQSSRRDILDRITQCGYTFNGTQSPLRQCAQPTRITTHTPASTWDNATQTALPGIAEVNSNDKLIHKDVNGDGISDIILMKRVNVAPNTVCINFYERDPDFDYAGCSGHFEVSVYALEQGQYVLKNDNLGAHQHLLYAGLEGDINRDGITDFLTTEGNQLVRLQFTHDYAFERHNTGFYLHSQFNKLNLGQGAQIVDMDADGFQDIVFTRYGDNGAIKVVMYRSLPHTIDGSRQSFASPTTLFTPQVTNGNSPSQESVQLMDVDGDGLLDLVMSYSPPNTRTVQNRIAFASKNANGSLNYSVRTASALGLPTNTFFHQTTWGDINGDGLVDFIKADGTSRLFWSVQLNKGNRAFAPAIDTGTSIGLHRHTLADSYGSKRTQALYGGLKVADMDNDGMDELVVATSASGTSCATISGELYEHFTVPPTGFIHIEACDDEVYQTTFENTEPNPREIDMDMSMYDFRLFNWSIVDMKIQSGQVKYARTHYNRFSAPINSVGLMQNNGDRALIRGLQLQDLNNDGLLDATYTSHDHHYFEHELPVAGYILKRGHLSITSNTVPGNFIAFNTTHDTNKLADVVSAIDNGVGLKSEWQYAAMSSTTPINGKALYSVPQDREDFYINTHADAHGYVASTRREKDTQRHHFYFTSSMPLVTRFLQSNGVGGMNESRYRYKEAVYNTQGRGFMGFRSITVDNVAAKRSTETVFRQMFPFVSVVDAQYQFVLGDDKAYATTCNEWSVNAQHDNVNDNQIVQTYLATQQSRTYDVASSGRPSAKCTGYVYAAPLLINTKEVGASDIDRYGNILKQTTVQNDMQYGVTTVVNTADYSQATPAWPHKQSAQSSTSSFAMGYQLSTYFSAVASEIEKVSTRTSRVLSWDNTHRKPKQVQVDSGQLSTKPSTGGLDGYVVTTTQYNAYGLPTDVTVTGQVDASRGSSPYAVSNNRKTTFTYTNNGQSAASDGYFVLTQKVDSGNTINGSAYRYHTATSYTRPETGLVGETIAANGVRTLMAYDGMGRPVQVLSEGMKAQYTQYRAPDNYEPAQNNQQFAQMMVTTTQAGSPNTYTYLDSLGRTLRSSIVGFDGARVHTDVQYNARGLALKESKPFKHGTTAYYTIYEQYDDLGRLTKKKTSGTQTNEYFNTSYTYQGTTTSINTTASDGHNLHMTRQYSVGGLLMQTTDAIGGVTRYAYNSTQQPVVVEDANQSRIIAYYDAMGRKNKVNDPNQGITLFTYNDFGELEREKDANNQTVFYDYDLLGRSTHKYAPTGTASFVYDSKSIGALSEATRSGYKIAHTYDSIGRNTVSITTIDNMPYLVQQAYDDYGRIERLTYPSQANLAIQYEYNSRGYLTSEKDANTQYEYRRVTTQDAWGNITAGQLANGQLTTQANYSSATGQMLSTTAKRYGNTIHSWFYNDFDSYGNLRTQENTRYASGNNLTMTETFTYDKLHRLTVSNVSGQPTSHTSINENTYYGFDAVGNITYKSDFSAHNSSAYQYVYTNGKKTNRLRSVLLPSNTREYYGHDNKGNLTTRAGKTEFTYNTMNKPTYINRMGTQINLYYDAMDMRYKQVSRKSGTTTTTHYVGKLFEVEIKGSQRKYTSYISDVAIKSSTEGVKFTLKDRLGSTTTLTNASASDITYRNFDAFGKPRAASGKQTTTSPYGAKLAQYNDSTTDRGFTDHEHLDDVEIIHMNGRVYDYNVGRFLSVDPFIQGSGSQSINPYSYIMNNPLAGTDPTGYVVCETRGGPGCKTSDEEERNGRLERPWDKYQLDDNGSTENEMAPLDTATTTEDISNLSEQRKIGVANQSEFDRDPFIPDFSSPIPAMENDKRVVFDNPSDAVIALFQESKSVIQNEKKIKTAHIYPEIGVAGYIMEKRRTGFSGDVVSKEYYTIKAELSDENGINPSGRADQTVNIRKSIGFFSDKGLFAKVIITSKSAEAVFHNESMYKKWSHRRGKNNLDGKPIDIFVGSSDGNDIVFQFHSLNETKVFEQ